MPTTQADEKRRVTIPDATPGDVFEVRNPGNGDFLLVRVSPTTGKPSVTRAESLKAMERSSLKVRMSWEELRQLTREP